MLDGADEVFVDDFRVLRGIYPGLDRAGIRQASSILRRWFIDGEPLVHIVNRPSGRRVKIRFRVQFDTGVQLPKTSVAPSLRIINVGPPASELNQARSILDLEAFLATHACSYEGADLSIRDFIKYFANSAGGVHYDPPRPGHVFAQVSKIAQRTPPGSDAIATWTMRQIVCQALLALEPLYFLLSQD